MLYILRKGNQVKIGLSQTKYIKIKSPLNNDFLFKIKNERKAKHLIDGFQYSVERPFSIHTGAVRYKVE